MPVSYCQTEIEIAAGAGEKMNLKKILESAVEKYVDKVAIVIGERRVSFTELDDASNRVANALIEMGLQKGDRVATLQASNPEFVTIFFGIAKAGGIAVPLDSRYVADELHSLFDDCRPKIIVAEDPPLESLLPALPRFESVEHVIVFSPQEGPGFISYDDIITKSPNSKINVPVDQDDTIIISYTGGPTQKPHGVELSHRGIYIEAVNSALVFDQTDRDILIQFALPMYHQFGLTSVLMASIATGNTVVVVPGTGRSINSFMETVERERGTVYMGVPYIYALMINVARREGIQHDLSSLRVCACGGAPLPVEIITEFKKYFDIDLLDVWGQTETVSQATVQPIDGTGPLGATGKPMPCWEIKIFDDKGRELPPNREGEIVIRGPIMTGFYKKPEATAKLITNGWLRTGDIGRIDDEGFLFITARKRRMLILKGQNIFPQDIEDVLGRHPKIAEVKIAGVSDVIRGETVKAIVKLKAGEKATEQEIRQYCQGRMADYKIPREVLFTEIMPEAIDNWVRPASAEVPEL
jgi:long-chain acyl-CoA synthetase